ncbi:LysE/ArgO family amino acid transporter [Microbacterium trichothecenolyticum]|uniref:L-lysine exporter family protein LysE/ArgO n=1 Tax=Microbacterium trichothecenolyticum TaxID=69370 RepID=A0ABU0TYE6_MICTR|nr:LysE/ArgO family amino acid transporter [Microbacterium trichothecenolyticum]MDQ1124673.1 L-lysine exporter family protein LysE/ArgO [Microbacterium trichothecenolyticum]
MLTPLLAGLGLGFSLIVAIGAQNLFVLRQGIRREHLVAVVAVCALSDAVLIVLGVSGVGIVLQAIPWLIVVVRWAGAAFLIGYGLLAARRAVRPSGATLRVDVDTPASPSSPDAGGTTVQTRPARTSLAATLLTCLALTWLNPHVYLDTVFLLGSIASTHGEGRWAFALGACLASLVWFSALGFGARFLGRWLDTPRAWRVLDALIAVVMFAIALSLVLPH